VTELTASQTELLSSPLSVLEKLTVRTINTLEKNQILTVRDLLMTRPETILCFANVGEKTLEEIYAALAEHGFVRAKKGRSHGSGREAPLS
jgi:DNA-directed RNA polymerase alpha subunit